MDEQSGSFHRPIETGYRRPGWVIPFLFVSLTGAMACVWIADVSAPFRMVLLLIIIGAGLRDHRQLLHDRSGILLDRNDQWFLLDSQGTAIPASLACATICQPGFIVLMLKDAEGCRYSFILTAAGHDRTILRRLRVRLYHPIRRERAPGEGSPGL